ncbi:NAD-binding protein [Roseibium salinum]|nr:NAD-binding protein [Roseibium salinum]
MKSLKNSAAAAPVLAYRKDLYLDEQAHDVSFTVALARKDVGLALDLARTLGVIMPQAELNETVLTAAGEAGYDTRDMASILTFVKKRD